MSEDNCLVKDEAEVAFRWYVLQVQPLRERSIRDKIQKLLLDESVDNVQRHVGEIFIPEEDVYESNSEGNKKVTQKVMYRGYIYINMRNVATVWHFLKHKCKVKLLEEPIHDKKIEEIKQSIESTKAKPRPLQEYNIGEMVEVIDGPFATFKAKVTSEVNEKDIIKVSISIFGRDTSVDLSVNQIQKIKE